MISFSLTISTDAAFEPIVTVDVSGYWTALHAQLQAAVDSGFMRAESLGLIVNVEGVADVLPAFRMYEAPRRDKWVDLDET